MGVTLITLSGIEKDAQGAVTGGVIAFTLSSNLVDASGNIVYNAGTHHVTVDPLTGLWSIVLAATKGDAGITPTGATWAVVKHMSGAGDSFEFELDAALGTPQFLADLTPVENSTHVYGLPLTAFSAKGDLLAGTASAVYDNLAVGTNGKVLTTDSAEATGLKWATPASGVTDHGLLTGLSDNDHAGVYDVAGTAASAVSTHAGLADPHPGYLTPAEGNAAYDPAGAASTVNTALSTHAALTNNPHAVTAAQASAVPSTQVTGGGVVATGGFTLTVPATGTAALLGAANAFTVAQSAVVSDAVTNTTTVAATLGHNSSATPLASYGTGLLFQGKSATVADRDMARIQAVWSTATDATRTSYLALLAVTSAGALVEGARVTTLGLQAARLRSNIIQDEVDNNSYMVLTRVSASSKSIAIGSVSDTTGITFNTKATGNIGLLSASDFGGGLGVIGIKDANTVPSTNPVGGGVLYVEAGSLKFRGSSGTITVLGVA